MKSIRFNSFEVMKTIAGEKSEMRIPIKTQPMYSIMRNMKRAQPVSFMVDNEHLIKPPYQPSEIVWVRETWKLSGIEDPRFIYRASDTPFVSNINLRWEPSIRMPCEAARLYLRIIDVCAERLQDITLQGIQNEGVWLFGSLLPDLEYVNLWEKKFTRKQCKFYSWKQNPWVWVYTYEKCEKPKEC